ncbi:conserved Plasmodium protein, unknown function [Plasmodium gallinaceum]|uniref:Mic1 domain-containing protein n=1 Tax=Plasmodium gallinaceum TaxID=5849 RepID=A0A1J1GMA1_PLAGA|nr:conserved Plasmodium protein, unknown function [Plasmodium gallinaceum]CRG93568.1 conserved Plasmodium protein, unknown function [Plasmodium gallinaceum]
MNTSQLNENSLINETDLEKVHITNETEENKKKEKNNETAGRENLLNELSEQNKKILKKTKKNTAISTYSPAYISDPIYQWEVSSSDRIFYDKINDFIIHQNVSTKALLVTDIKKNEENYNGVYVKFDKELCENICFCSNGSFFLYYCINPNKIEISDILNNHNIYLNVEINKLNEYELLSAFWLNNINLKDKNETLSSSDFVIVTNNSIEIFKFSFDNLVISPLKKHFIKSQYCWYDENSSYIALLSNKSHVIFPYLLSNSNAIKLPKIELNILKNDNINKNDIEIITLYNETYCIHKDHRNGRISFRCLSSALYFDYVLDLFYNGFIYTFSIDNLLVVFNNSNEKVYIFDIMYKKNKGSINSLSHQNNHTINISYLTTPKPFKSQINFNYVTFKPFNVLIDNHYGNVYKIKIDYDMLMLQICQHFSNLNTSVDVLLRRPNCKNRITEMFFLALENDIKIGDFLSIVNIINVNYRKLIERSAHKNSSSITKTNKKIIQSFDHLLKNLGDKTLITERDIVADTFHPYMIKKYNLDKKETLFNFSLNFRENEKNKKNRKKFVEEKNNSGEKYMLKYKIKKKIFETSKTNINSDESKINNELDENKNETKREDTSNHESNNNTLKNNEYEIENNINNDYKLNLNYSDFHNIPMFLIYALEYMKSLLYLNIIPNRILQTFIFDLCIFFKQDNCLRQLLQFYVISDSVEVTKRLFHYWKLTEHKWAYQFCLDMSLRLKEYEMVIHLFLSSKKYLNVISFIRNYNLFDYPISVIFQAIENDFDSPDKYIIFNHIILSLNTWITDYEKDPVNFSLPNLQNCEKWVKLIED